MLLENIGTSVLVSKNQVSSLDDVLYSFFFMSLPTMRHDACCIFFDVSAL